MPTNVKRIDVLAEFPVTLDPAAAPGAGRLKVPDSTGVVLWLPWRSPDSVERFGIVPVGTDDYTAVNTRVGILSYPNSGVLLPYVRTDDAYIKLSGINTNVDGNFPFQRLFAGVLSLQADTISIGNLSLTGHLAAAAVQDVRLALLAHETNPGAQYDNTDRTQVCDVAEICSKAMTSKDGVKHVSGEEGVCTVLGPDIVYHMEKSGRSGKVIHRGGRLYPPTQLDTRNISYQTILAGDLTERILYAGWISGFNVRRNNNAPAPWNSAPSNVIINQPDMANPIGAMIEVHITIRLQRDVVSEGVGEDEYTVRFTDVWGAVAPTTGEITYFTRVTQKTFYKGTSNDVVNNRPYEITHDASWQYPGTVVENQAQTTFTRIVPMQGLLVGTYVEVTLRALDSTALVRTGASSARLMPGGHACTIQGRIVNDGQLGELCPARVMRWDNMGRGQVVRLSGHFLMEYYPGVYTAGLSTSEGAERCENASALNLAGLVYNDPGTKFARVWAINDYNEFCRNLDVYTDPGALLDIRSDTVRDAVYAAGYTYRQVNEKRSRKRAQEIADVEEEREKADNDSVLSQRLRHTTVRGRGPNTLMNEAAPYVPTQPSGRFAALDNWMDNIRKRMENGE
jgi:hypothetical protein